MDISITRRDQIPQDIMCTDNHKFDKKICEEQFKLNQKVTVALSIRRVR